MIHISLSTFVSHSKGAGQNFNTGPEWFCTKASSPIMNLSSGCEVQAIVMLPSFIFLKGKIEKCLNF